MDFVEVAWIQQGVMHSFPVVASSSRKLGNEITCKTKLFIYMTFDINRKKSTTLLCFFVFFFVLKLISSLLLSRTLDISKPRRYFFRKGPKSLL